MRAPWIFAYFFLIFSSNVEFHSGGIIRNPEYDALAGRRPYCDYCSHGRAIHSPPPPVARDIIYPPNAPQPLPTANLSTTWTNDEPSIPSINFTDGSRIRVILDEESFACGFFCNGNCTSYLFAIVIKLSYSQRYTFGRKGEPTVIWSANRDYPVRKGAKLNLTAAGDLVLKDTDGRIVWTTNTTRKSVAGMKLDDNGNLMLSNANKSMVWQSFDHPTDCLVRGQKLYHGQKLIPSVSSTDWRAQKDLYTLQVTEKGLLAYIESNPPLIYYRHLIDGTNTTKGMVYAELLNGSLGFFDSSSAKLDVIDIPQIIPLQYIKLMPDGHLKAFGGETDADLLIQDDFGECSYPLACGRNAICSDGIQCTCLKSSSFGTKYFRAEDDSQPNKGCSRVDPLRCNATQDQDFIEFKNIKYITYTSDMANVDMETCKQACLNNCTCKAAIFAYRGSNSSSGYCNLPSEIFTMTSFDVNANNQVHASAFIKVQNGKHKPQTKRNIGVVVGSLLFLIVVVGFTMSIVRKRKRANEIEEENLEKVTGMPTRFSHKELETATKNFSNNIGKGGFGSVFEGTLEDGSGIAVKCLQSLDRLAIKRNEVEKSFLAEVESIGSIHHVNLVRLRGFCAWKSKRFLVYEFMSNGSLDKWIYDGDRKHLLGWERRKKIILDIAKGLAYLHEECRQKIIHLDIKPQNILLDEDLNAKVSDFGLSKLIDRNQSQVMAGTRGTLGYMAPECFKSSMITEKVDVYSFGIVLLEILCGRKNFDKSQPEESWHLLFVFQRCLERGTLISIVDVNNEDMKIHGTEVMEMMKLASWCLQTDFKKRPSMSSVIKVIEGVMEVESNLDYNFLSTCSTTQKITDEHEKRSKTMEPSILSGPR